MIEKWNNWFITDVIILSIYLKGIFPILQDVILKMGTSLSSISLIAYTQSAFLTSNFEFFLVVLLVYYFSSIQFFAANTAQLINVLLSLYINFLMLGLSLVFIAYAP